VTAEYNRLVDVFKSCEFVSQELQEDENAVGVGDELQEVGLLNEHCFRVGVLFSFNERSMKMKKLVIAAVVYILWQ
jgi:hypothetical protein